MTSIQLYIVAGIFAIGATVFTTLGWIANKREQGKSSAALGDKVGTLKTDILAALEGRNRSMHDRLRDRYPYGYVLFGGEGGNMVNMPFYDGGLFVEAKWEETKIELDRTKKLARITIAQPTWKQESGASVHIVSRLATAVVHYTVGKPVTVGIVRARNQPVMLFEVIDENQRTPIYAIGFRKPEPE